MQVNSFLYPEIKESDRQFAGTFPVINPRKDWKGICINELQSQKNIEPSSCFIESQQAIIATLMEYTYGIKDSNFSARFNALLSNGTEMGGDPVRGALSLKKDGLIPQSMMDWEGVNSFDDFHSWKNVDKEKCLLEGKNFANLWDMSYKIIFEKDVPLKTKQLLIEDWLTKSPVAVSVCAWFEKDGVYYKPEGMCDTHLTMVVVGIDDKGQFIVRDSYEPFYKTLAKDTDFEFAIGWSVRKRTDDEIHSLQLSLFSQILKLLYEMVSNLKSSMRGFGKLVSEILSKKN